MLVLRGAVINDDWGFFASHGGSGIGANNDVDFNWLETQDMFSSMLTDLNAKLGQPGTGGASSEVIEAAAASTAASVGTDAAKPRRGMSLSPPSLGRFYSQLQ